jgi:serine/threonine protein kinase
LAAKPGTSPSSDDRPTDTIRWIGQYQVVSVIKVGGQGVVYRAIDNIGRDVAIKELLLSQVAPDEIAEARQRFLREARAVGKLRHNNVVILHQFLPEPDSLYLVMEFVPGGSLHELMKAETPLTTGEVLGIVGQVAAALDYAHANGIVHRDIKPGNILVGSDPVSRRPVMKVTDFGIARVSSETLTTTGVALGTPAYMAPEQIKGLKVHAKADQFSLAVVAYQLLGGRLPFTAPDDHALMFQIVNAEPASVLEANPDLPPEVDRVIRRALAKNPDQRFASCGAFADALSQAVSPPAPTTRRTVPGKSGVNRILLTARWVAFLAVAVAGVLYLGRLVPDPHTTRSPSVGVPKVAESKSAVDTPRKETQPRGREEAPNASTATKALPAQIDFQPLKPRAETSPKIDFHPLQSTKGTRNQPLVREKESSKLASSASARKSTDAGQMAPPIKTPLQPAPTKNSGPLATSRSAPRSADAPQTAPPVETPPQAAPPKDGAPLASAASAPTEVPRTAPPVTALPQPPPPKPGEQLASTAPDPLMGRTGPPANSLTKSAELAPQSLLGTWVFVDEKAPRAVFEGKTLKSLSVKFMSLVVSMKGDRIEGSLTCEVNTKVSWALVVKVKSRKSFPFYGQDPSWDPAKPKELRWEVVKTAKGEGSDGTILIDHEGVQPNQVRAKVVANHSPTNEISMCMATLTRDGS